MHGDVSVLDEYLGRAGTDGYLVEGDGDLADQLYLSGFWAPDSYVTVYVDGSVHCMVKPLEVSRAGEEGHAASVANVAEYGFYDRLEDSERHEAWAATIEAFCADHGVSSASVPYRFPVGLANELDALGMDVEPDLEWVIGELRAVKSEPELEAIAESQAAAEAAMARAEALLDEASVDADGVLHHGDAVLTSERVKTAIERTLLDHRCTNDDVIVACGGDAADPHDRGSGPLEANETIIIDIFPRHKGSHYFGELTRTFVKGEPSDVQREWFELTLEAQETALDAIAPGVFGEEIYHEVCDLYEDAGHPTIRADPNTETGFIHSVGHGVGLELHEDPSISRTGEALEVHHVVAVEPGLYDPDVGGVRLEDLVVVTTDGCHNLTDYPKELRVD